MVDLILGADPGGKGKNASGNFGWALVHYTSGKLPPQPLRASSDGTAANAHLAFNAATAAAGRNAIVAVGVDAPLGYDAGHDRAIDDLIRRALNTGKQTPVMTNSLRGAALVQGVVFARLAHAALPKAAVTESYPRAVRDLPGGLPATSCSLHLTWSPNCHPCDATLVAASAWACAEGRSGRQTPNWKNLHTVSANGRLLQPQHMIVPNHEYWLPWV